MRKTAVLNSHISGAIATLGHYELLTINDAGMPTPNSDRHIDLAVTKSLPRFIDMLETVLTEMEIQKVYLAEEIRAANAQQLKAIKKLISDDVKIKLIAHSEMKEMLKSLLNKGSMRTGEITPFSDIILESNVTF